MDAGGVTAPGAPLTTLAGTAAGATDVCGAATTAVAAGTLTNTKLYSDKLHFCTHTQQIGLPHLSAHPLTMQNSPKSGHSSSYHSCLVFTKALVKTQRLNGFMYYVSNSTH